MSEDHQQQQMDYGEEGAEGQQYEGDDHNLASLYHNNHDLIGVEGIIRAQKNEIEKKKVFALHCNLN